MKEIEKRLPECIGSSTGKALGAELIHLSEDVQLTFHDVEAMDVSFVIEAIIKPAQQMHAKGFMVRLHLLLVSEDALWNLQAACALADWPVRVWIGGVKEILLGPGYPVGCVEAYTAVVQGLATAREVSDRLQISISNASNKLTQLWRLGFLVRTERSAETGGIEYVYRA